MKSSDFKLNFMIVIIIQADPTVATLFNITSFIKKALWVLFIIIIIIIIIITIIDFICLILVIIILLNSFIVPNFTAIAIAFIIIILFLITH